jgi:hypothetical protein
VTVIGAELLPHPLRFSAAAAPALAPTPARNLRRETPLLINPLKLATFFSLVLTAGLAGSLLSAVRAKECFGLRPRKIASGRRRTAREEAPHSRESTVEISVEERPRSEPSQDSVNFDSYPGCFVGGGSQAGEVAALLIHLRKAAKSAASPKSIKKRPLGYACLDEFQICQTKGARSRNHKKMGCPAKHWKRIAPFLASA